jgi:hypothetical protein
MTSIGFGDITPLTKIEKAVSLFVMIIGASTYGSLFGAFVVIIDDLQAESKEKKEVIEALKQWIEVRKINKELKNRLLHYEMTLFNHHRDIKKFDVLDDLPLSLLKEVTMAYWEDLVHKVKLFELANSEFILDVVCHLKPNIYMPQDLICI